MCNSKYTYEGKIPLPQNKIKDLQEMLKNRYIPDEFISFYNDIIGL